MNVELEGNLLTIEFDNDEQIDTFFRMGLTELLEGKCHVVAPTPDLTSEAKTYEIPEKEYSNIVGFGILQCLERNCES